MRAALTARRFLGFLVALFPLALFVGCHTILGLDDPTVVRDDGGSEVGPPLEASTPSDTSTVDAGDAGDAEPDVIVTYNEEWTNSTFWSSVDLAKINVGTTSFAGGVFDGRYIYLPPSSNTLQTAFAARYDTQGNKFTVTTSWDFFDTASLHPEARGFESSFFDGRYVYFVPFATTTKHVGLMVRYDTKSTAGFASASSWEIFDITQFNPNAKGFMGGAFDGTKYAYMAPGTGVFPEGDGGRPQAVVARFDTSGGLGNTGAYQFFDTQTVSAQKPRGFFGTVLTKDHLYLIPYGYDGTSKGRVVRYALAKPFTDLGSWEMFDVATLDPQAIGYNGGAFDGRYLYLTPFLQASGFHGRAARYDTTKAFDQGASWTVYNVENLDGGVAAAQVPTDGGTIHRHGYSGAGFDGRFVYFVPYSYGTGTFGHGWVARYDTQAPFDADTSWRFYDMAALNPDAAGFVGAVFDGQYMYFIPSVTSVVVRFYAKFPAKMPPGLWGGSFL